MKIFLISDLHVGLHAEDTYGVNVRQNFLDIMSKVEEGKPDYLILTGDLSFQKGNIQTYEWLKDRLDKSQIPYDIIAGNHDNSSMLAKVFRRESELHSDVLFYKKHLNGWNCLFLDTAVRVLSSVQIEWLQQELSTTDMPVMIFMHHPPLSANAPFMDNNHALLNMEEVQQTCAVYKGVIPIFSGHYHNEITIHKGNMVVQITPSCFFQIDRNCETFKIDHYQIAYREINLMQNSWTSSVRYFDGNRF